MEIIAGLAQSKGKSLKITKLTLDEPRDNEVLIKMVTAGICRTDIDVMEQYINTPLPAVLGHEGAGIVIKVGNRVTKVVEGDHVVLSLSSCGECEKCKLGLPSYCIKHIPLNFGGSRLDGSVCLHCSEGNVHSHFFGQSSHASYSVVDQTSIIKVSKNADLRYLAPFACGIMTGAGGILNTLKPEAGTSIVIYGMGAVGLSAIMAAKIAGCNTIIAVDISANRLKLAKEVGATHVLNGTLPDLTDEILNITGGQGANYAFESSGVKAVMTNALNILQENGTLILTGVLPQGTKVEFDSWNLLRGRTIKGSIMGDCVPEIFIPKLISFFEEGRFPVDKMMKFFSLTDINQAINESLSGETIKAVISFD